MPPSVDILMSSKKIPHNVGGIGCTGWRTSTVILAGSALKESAANIATSARCFLNFIVFIDLNRSEVRRGWMVFGKWIGSINFDPPPCETREAGRARFSDRRRRYGWRRR